MKLKVTEDFKKAARGMVIYVVVSVLCYPVIHLVKGDFSWEETLSNALIALLVAVVLGVFFFFGMQIPEKDGK